MLRELNAAARTAVPDEATTAAATVFVPARWRGYLDAARGQGRDAAYRHYWELSVLYGVQAGLRSGDLWVPGSRRYTDPSTLLLPPDRWSGQRDDFCTVTGTGGMLSSSDGQRFPQRGRSLTARALSRYFLDEGTTTYTHVSDQHFTYGTKVIPTTWREAVTLATFAIFHLAGLHFSPRIRDIGRLQLYRLGPGSAWRSRYPHAGRLLGQPIQTQLIADHWDDLLRLVASMKFGHTTASLLIAKLHASSRQSTPAKALHEYGRLVRSLYVCRYVADEELRRRVRRQLNKGESLHALRRDLFFAHQGHVR